MFSLFGKASTSIKIKILSFNFQFSHTHACFAVTLNVLFEH